MDQGYKHFSHLHNLIMHEMPEGINVSCSGCHSSATGTVYVCWSCKFFLHDQCYRASRSMKHPSHPSHPLTLVAFPTYNSNSFYCNSCQLTGTGFSYSCAECEFDLHVQCAYSISRATSFKNPHQFKELVPSGWNGMHNSKTDHHFPFVSVPESLPIPFTSVQYHSTSYDLASGSIPHHSQNSTTNVAQDPSITHTLYSDSIPKSYQILLANVQYSSMDQTPPSVSIPTNPTHLINPSTPRNEPKDTKIAHFSHPHNLSRVTLQEDEKTVICSGCEETLVANGYSCVEPDCKFHLHELCFHLEKEINHKSHPEHPLTLLPRAPYNKKDDGFTCNACFNNGTCFTYHCSICKIDLHIQCAGLPERVKRDDHEHLLKLLYSFPVKYEDYTFSCDVCHGEIQKDRWAYYCESCDYGSHLGCVDCEGLEIHSIVDTQAQFSIVDTQAQFQRLQLQMQIGQQQAQFMANMHSSLGSFAINTSYVKDSI